MARSKKVVRAAVPATRLLADLRGIIAEARVQVARSVNSSLVMLYWHVGRRIRDEVLQRKRAEYGQQILPSLSARLTAEFGPGWTERNLAYMVRFADAFAEERILHTLCAKLGWSHFRLLVGMEDRLKRDFYADMCRVEGWTVRTLGKKIDSMLFERTALSRKPGKLIEQELKALRDEDRLTPDLVFRDPYLLDFLGLKHTYAEKDLEAAILRDMEAFLLELGVGFAFLDRQKRITVGGDDYYLDLHERRPGEDAPIGLILCAGKKDETVRLLDMEGSGIRVAAYWTESLPREQLEHKLHEIVALARRRLERVSEA